jgi:hypothetical protein
VESTEKRGAHGAATIGLAHRRNWRAAQANVMLRLGREGYARIMRRKPNRDRHPRCPVIRFMETK